MGRLIAQTRLQPIRPRRRRTWDADGFGGIREAERTVNKAQRDSDARERAGQSGLGRENRDGTPSDGVRENKNGKTIGQKILTGFTNAGKLAVGLVTGGPIGLGIAATKIGIDAYKNRAASGGGSPARVGSSRNGDGPPARTNDRNHDAPVARPAVSIAVRPVAVATPTIIAPAAPVPVVAPAPTAPSTLTPYYIQTPNSAPQLQPFLSAIRTEPALPQAWPGQPVQAAGWMDQEMIPGIKNQTALIGAGALTVALVVLMGGQKKEA